MTTNTKGALKEAAENAIRQFIEILDGEETTEFYNLVLAEVEEPLLRVVMEYTANNQSRGSHARTQSRYAEKETAPIQSL